MALTAILCHFGRETRITAFRSRHIKLSSHSLQKGVPLERTHVSCVIYHSLRLAVGVPFEMGYVQPVETSKRPYNQRKHVTHNSLVGCARLLRTHYIPPAHCMYKQHYDTFFRVCVLTTPYTRFVLPKSR